jgi:hypothetical protein
VLQAATAAAAAAAAGTAATATTAAAAAATATTAATAATAPAAGLDLEPHLQMLACRGQPPQGSRDTACCAYGRQRLLHAHSRPPPRAAPRRQ